MLRLVEEARRRGIGALAGLILLASGAAQQDGPGGERRDPQDPAAAVEKWLATDHTSEELMGETVRAVLEQPDKGLVMIGGMLQKALEQPGTPRSKGLRSLVVQVTLEHLRRTDKSGMVFVGQYGGLAPLRPWVNDFLFGLLLDTPEWYPFTFRVRLVPPLRDLQDKLPSEDRVQAIVALIEDEREQSNLRHALAGAMWQWGRKQYAEKFLQGLRRATGEGDGEDRLQATLDLADYYNFLRDYRSAARTHRAAQALAKGAGTELRPVSWYAAACVHALLGDKEQGMAALERCARMMASPDLDRSLRLERKLWDEDPEIALLRADERFAALVELAFGKPKQEPAKDGGR